MPRLWMQRYHECKSRFSPGRLLFVCSYSQRTFSRYAKSVSSFFQSGLALRRIMRARHQLTVRGTDHLYLPPYGLQKTALWLSVVSLGVLHSVPLRHLHFLWLTEGRPSHDRDVEKKNCALRMNSSKGSTDDKLFTKRTTSLVEISDEIQTTRIIAKTASWRAQAT